MAVLWTEKEVEVNQYCLGHDHPDFQTEMDVLVQLRDAARSKKQEAVSLLAHQIGVGLGSRT